VALGAKNQRAVLTDGETFRLPISATENMKLAQHLVNLNRSLHSMTGDEHVAHKGLLFKVLNGLHTAQRRACIWKGLERVTSNPISTRSGILRRMRELTSEISMQMLFGENSTTSSLSMLLRNYFELRRAISSLRGSANSGLLESLITTGDFLDAELRFRIRECRQHSDLLPKGVLDVLSKAEISPGILLTEDEIVGHVNVVFISSTEPIAVALAWMLLILTQSPQFQKELREEVTGMPRSETPPNISNAAKMTLLDQLIHESLRLLSPNAFMTRTTSQRTLLNGAWLPKNAEILLCPLLSHRDETVFDKPLEFRPTRWRDIAPSPFVYFPFGAGVHSCVGKTFSIDLIKTALMFVLQKFSVSLAGNQEIDWQIQIMFMPDPDPEVEFTPLSAGVSPVASRLGGKLGQLISLSQLNEISSVRVS